MAHKHSQIVANAKKVVSDPAYFANQPGLRMLAWAALMSSRGQRVDQVRIRQMQGPHQKVVKTGTA